MTFGEARGFMKGVSSPDDEARRVLDASLNAGIDFIDTADVYSEGRSEELLGEWLGARRAKLAIATKCRFPMSADATGANDFGLSRRHIVEACEGSLRRLKTDWIDLYQVHMQDSKTPIEETMRALDDLVTAGKIRYAGCSNYAGYRLTEALWASDRRDLIRYDSIQLMWNLTAREAERELIPAARAFGLGVLVWSPLARGFLTGKYRRGEPPPDGARLAAWRDTWAKVATERSWAALEVVGAVAARRNATMAAVSLAWLLKKPEVTTIILGARTIAQLNDNLACLEVQLTDDDMKELDKASQPDWGYPYDFIGGREPW
jgi:aryl-alcohol dehydrogenase-like predicted oxidoreductase